MRCLTTKLYNFWQLTRANLLYVPVIISVVFVFTGIGVLQIDLYFKGALVDKRFIYNGNAEEASDVLGLLLTCMITMTTLVISITMVVLSLAASQLGPRLVRIFMGDGRTKIFIGIFFGSIALCFTCIGVLHDPVASESTPRLLTSFTFLVCFLNLFILLAYVNHVARSGVADNIIVRLTRELLKSIDRLAPDRDIHTGQCKVLPKKFVPDPASYQQHKLCSPVSGYIQSIEYHSLLQVALKCDGFIHMCYKPGDYVVKGQQMGDIYTMSLTSDISSDLNAAILIGDYRSATQDIEYSVRHMVEIALRALSPGVNDPFTAITVLDKLTGVLGHLFTRFLPNCSFTSDDGKLRVWVASTTEADVIFEALAEICYAGQNQRLILECLIKNIAILTTLANTSEQRRALALQIEHVKLHITSHFSGSPTGEILQRLLQSTSSEN